ncbi:MAG: HipA domain-containing protein [Eubacterium sp.]|nr:HipA domain-containing protein [Eubacterium sp.]
MKPADLKKSVDITIEIAGTQTLTGTISGSTVQDYRFQYDSDYLSRPAAVPISISLPLQNEPFSPEATAAFFNGLLPEGFTRLSVANWMHEQPEDYLAILAGLGSECLGAIQVLSHDFSEITPAPSYELLTLDQVRELAQEGASVSTELVTRAHLSLTGASGKVGLYLDDSGRWYLPKGNAPSTHIVKQSHIRLQSIVTNEQMTQQTASRLGIEVPESFIINTGDGRDQDVLLATKRYDRRTDANSPVLAGLPVPYRLHQEDFAQAMGIPSEKKYEKENQFESGYLPLMFRLIRSVSKNPLDDMLKLWDRIVFCFLAGNTDSHIKNFSLLYDGALKSMRLAPAYDLVSTAVYKSSTRDMAFFIGDEISLDRIGRHSFETAAGRCGINPALAMKRLDIMCSSFEAAIRESSKALKELGLPDTNKIRDQILLQGGYGKIV